MPQHLRVFISSPGDVPDERLRADLVVDKVAQDFSRFFTFETYRWEHEPMLASGHFQDAIDPPSKADIVILILWSRLGTPLPEKTGAREYRGLDGRAPVTGTEWEYEDALQAARTSGAPDILAFRNVSPAAIDTRDPTVRQRNIAQLDALDTFWKRHFADRGVFLAAYDEYQTLEEFARRLEESFRKLIERRVAAQTASGAGEAPLWPGDPFRGLEPYEFEHAQIFFGRDGLVAKAAEQLAAGARAGTAFLLVTGPSGSGKSSVVKAALVPRLMKPQRIQGAAFLRRAVFRPGDRGGDVILGLVEALTRSHQDGVGLPEMLAPGQDAAKLAAHLRAAVDEPGFVFAGALGHLTQDGRRDGRLLAFEEAKLILVIDQLEELFTTATISVADRQLFVRLMTNLARSGAVWIVATLRADFWHRAAEIPDLVALAQGIGRIDVSPPSPAELAEMIRKPAQAAGVGFEFHNETGLGLDSILAEHAADEPGVLPLLSFTLDALYASDVVKNGGRLLTFATYQSLGGLEGAIATRADAIVAELPAPAKAAVPQVIRALATISNTTAQVFAARAAPLKNFPDGSATRQVVDALTAGRLLVASDENAAATVRLAHEALISHWQRARDQLVADARDLQTRALIERQQARWTATTGRAKQQLLLRDPDLANAIDLSRRWGNELDPDTSSFIQKSRRRARLRQQLTAAAAVVFAVAAVAAVYGQYQARQARARAQENYASAKQAVVHLINDVAIGLSNVQGVRVEAIASVLDTVKKTIADLASANRNDVDLQTDTALMLREFADTYHRAGDLTRARASADESLALYRKLAAEHPGDRNFEYSVSESLIRMAYIRWSAGDRTGALDSANESLAIRRRLVAAEPTNTSWQGALAATLGVLASIIGVEDRVTALADFQESLAIHQKLAAIEPQNGTWSDFEKFDLRSIANLNLSTGDEAGALRANELRLALDRDLAAVAPADTSRQASIAFDLDSIGHIRSDIGDRAGALAAYTESLAIWRRLATSDPGNAVWQANFGHGLTNIAAIKSNSGDVAGALAAYGEGLDIARKLAAADPTDVNRQQDVSLTLDNIGNIKSSQSDLAGALAAFNESLAIHRKLLAADPKSIVRQGDVSMDLTLVATTHYLAGEMASALASAEESLAILRGLVLVTAGSANTQLLTQESADLSLIGGIRFTGGDRPGALAAYEESQSIARKLTEADPDNVALRNGLIGGLDQIGNIHMAMGDLAGALANYEEELAVGRKLSAIDPGSPFWQDFTATALVNIGDTQSEQGHQAAAEQAFNESLDIRRKLVAGDPTNFTWLADLGTTLHDIGYFRDNTGRSAQAIPAYQEALDIRRKIAAKTPDAPLPRYLVSLTLTQLGNAKNSTGDRAGALADYQEALTILRALLGVDPKNVYWQRGADLAQMGIGDVKAAQGDRDAARSAYEESLASLRKLTTADPGNMTWQADLVLNLRKASTVSDRDTAKAELREAQSMLEALDKDGKLTPDQQSILKAIRDKLAASQ